MRARLALQVSGQKVELREIVLRDKPAHMLQISPKGTVPVLLLPNGDVIEESLDVFNWALEQNDPYGWRDYNAQTLEHMDALIAQSDGPFKSALDRYKYENRYDNVVSLEQRDLAIPFLEQLNEMLEGGDFLFGDKFSIADGAILPFIRQFAHVDKEWFFSQNWQALISWLNAFLNSTQFADIMNKYPQWQVGDEPTYF